MQLVFQCPKCSQPARVDVPAQVANVACPHCAWSRAVPEGDREGEIPNRCLVCGCGDLWRQKDFPQRVGVAMVALGAILSTIAWAYTRPVLAIGTLMGFALVDLALFLFMPDVMVCYRCHARHRGAGDISKQPAFKLDIAERYRQESLRARATRS